MELLNGLGLDVNLTLLIAIVGVLEFIKKMDKKNSLKKYYPLIFIVFALAIGILLSYQNGSFTKSLKDGIVNSLFQAIVYLGMGTLFYQFILRMIHKFIDKKLGN